MSLADDLNNLNVQIPPCAVGRALLAMNPVEAESLTYAIDKTDISCIKISYVLKQHGYSMSTKTVSRHRNRYTDKERCSCQ